MVLNQRHAAICAVSFSAALPVLGPWFWPLAVLLVGLYRLFGIIAPEYLRLPLWEQYEMAGPGGVERRKKPRRDEDIMPMERLSAVEKEQRTLSKTLTRHVKGCESAAKRNEQDNAQIIKTQGEQGMVLADLQEVLPWLKQNYANKKARDETWHKVGDFFSNMTRKNWDTISGKLIYVVIAALLAYLGLPWSKILALLIGG